MRRLGAHLTHEGVEFAVYSEHAETVWLCLFDAAGREERVRMERGFGNRHCAHVTGVGAGQAYGYRVEGAYRPRAGHFFNPNKLLIDPYARVLRGEVDTRGPLAAGDNDAPCAVDTAPYVPRAIVTPALAAPRLPRVPVDVARLLLGEAHVRGLTMTHPAVPSQLRGTFRGAAHPAVLDHLQRLGVTALEVLPITALAVEPRLRAAGLTNYWGYSPASFFALNPRFAAPGESPEQGLAALADALHARHMSLVVDVVYNHTGELDSAGPMFSWRGLDNLTYYEWRDGAYTNPTGCGHAMRTEHPAVVALVMESLRHWVALGVDGFRFDLASILGRVHGAFSPHAPLLAAITQDPVLCDAVLCAEPWDAESYHLGRFPAGYREWNDRFRDDVRRFFVPSELSSEDAAHDPQRLGALASRLAGSSDLFAGPGMGATHGINFVSVHDGFTLHDQVCFAHRHNEANGEDNRDGHAHEVSVNYGVEGISSDPEVLRSRHEHVRALLMCLFLAKGVPLLQLGDELGRTQAGNNNAYCHDSALTWTDWSTERWPGLAAFIGALARLRASLPFLHTHAFYRGGPGGDLCWYRPDGARMSNEDWVRERGVLASFEGAHLLLLNGAGDTRSFVLPEGRYRVVLWSMLAEPPAAAVSSVTLLPRGVAWVTRDDRPA
jgi:glycogen operon protein